MAVVSHAVTTETIGFYGVPVFSYGIDDDDYDYNIRGTKNGGTYLEQKVVLLHQLGYPNVTEEDFEGCSSIVQIDNRARKIMGL